MHSQCKPKAIAAAEHLRKINSEVEIVPIVTDITMQEMEELTKEVDLILDATDNFDTRLLINDISQKEKIYLGYTVGCIGSYGVTYTNSSRENTMFSLPYGCILWAVPTCDTAGIIRQLLQMVVAHQVTEAMKILVDDYKSLRGTMLSFDIWNNQYLSLKVNQQKKSTCPSCGNVRTHTQV